MTYVSKNRGNRYKRILICSISALILVAATLIFIKMNKQTTDFTAEDAGSKLNTAGVTINVLRASRDIQAGEKADASKFEIVTVPKELAAAGYLTTIAQLQEKRLSVSLVKGELVLPSHLVDSASWYEDGDRLIEHSFVPEAIPATVDTGSIVDIKLFKQNALDVVVVSKAVVVGKAENTLSFYLNDMEQENIKEASTEGSVFLVQYLDHSQPASLITYQPSYDKSKAAARNNQKEDFANSNMNNN